MWVVIFVGLPLTLAIELIAAGMKKALNWINSSEKEEEVDWSTIAIYAIVAAPLYLIVWISIIM